jgi:TonB family protein
MPTRRCRPFALTVALVVTAGLHVRAAIVDQGPGPFPGDPAPAVPGQGPLRVGGDIPAPEKMRDARPIYPPAALAAGIQGVVIIEVTVGPDGRVTDARVLRTREDILTEPALDAVRQWEYEPTIFQGHPVSVLMTVTVNFSLGGGGLEDFGRSGVASHGGLPLSAPYDLTGEWTSDDGGTYQVRSVGSELFWFGLSRDRSRANIFHGTLQNPTEYRGRWADVPPGTVRESGTMTIRVVNQDRLEVAGLAPEFEGRRWQRVRPVSSETAPVRGIETPGGPEAR